jgi:hypothetical protein
MQQFQHNSFKQSPRLIVDTKQTWNSCRTELKTNMRVACLVQSAGQNTSWYTKEHVTCDQKQSTSRSTSIRCLTSSLSILVTSTVTLRIADHVSGSIQSWIRRWLEPSWVRFASSLSSRAGHMQMRCVLSTGSRSCVRIVVYCDILKFI